MRVAVMVACYNRKELTQRCLESLKKQLSEIAEKKFDIYVYDDGSTDGTYEMLLEKFPEVFVIRGKGNAYWCRSMHYLMKTAVDKKYDFYMMVNDDVYFYAGAIKTMFQSYREINEGCGIVGAFKSAYSKKGTYGGRNRQMELLTPNGKLQQCIWADWNCFLICADVVKKTGMIDGKYQHAWGDWDYVYRMIKKGFPIYETADYIGECELNASENTYRDSRLKKSLRLKKLFSPKGLPFYSYMRYNVRIKGFIGFFIAIYGYCTIIGHILLGKALH